MTSPDDWKTVATAPYNGASGRLRLNRNAGLTLSTTWQAVDLNGTSVRNVNTFPLGPDAVHQRAWYDSADKLLRFQGAADLTYDLTFAAKVTSSALLGALGVTASTVQVRYMVPAPTPVYFPLPDSDGCYDLCSAGLYSVDRKFDNLPITVTQAILDNGLQPQMRLQSGLGLATATVPDINVILYGRAVNP